MNISHNIMHRLLCSTFNHAIEKGTLHVTTPEHIEYSFVGKKPGAEAYWHIHDWGVVRALASRGDIGLGEAYAADLWDSEDLYALFCVFIDNIDALDRYANGSIFSKFWFRIVNHFLRRNSVKGSLENIRSHYDVGNDFYRLWLDPTMTYSSALYTHPDMTLEEAQKSKYQRILNHIGASRKHILEIGCGWGGFAEEAVKRGHALTGVTVSLEQHAFAKQRLGEKADIRLQDYRHVQGKFDAIASIEMFEAVGMRYWPSYFNTIKACLTSDGVAMVQTIVVKDAAFDDYVKRSDYLRHYVFPGGMLPSMTTFRACAEQAGLVCRDVLTFGQDYVKTLKEWLVQFEASEEHIRRLGHGNEFIRSWRLYMSICAASFACAHTNVMQVELVHA